MDEQANFPGLGLSEEIVKTLTALGYEAPTPIQARTIPVMLAGRDLIGQAQTGTGKTAAFALPILQKLDAADRSTQALVLTPTRELAMQVAEAIHSYGRSVEHISVLPVYGGAPMVPQLKRLDRGAQVVVGTPGRLIDHLDRGSLNLGSCRTVVLDEADEMLKMGFIDDVEKILSAIPEERQIALFSATMPDEVLRIAKRHLRNPERIEIEHAAINTPAIEQRVLNISEGQKLEVLTQILELESSQAVLVFRRTKTGAAELAEKLEARGFTAEALHGDMTQQMREAVVRRLRNGQVEVVVATDVAARGLDVEQIEHVINYDVPNDVEAYVHRIGRTGRAGRSGMATLFITPRERRMMREIERFTGLPIRPMKMPTRADVAAKRVEVFKESIRKTLLEGDLDLYVGLVEQLAEEGPHDLADVAAAAARLANGSRSLAPEAKDDFVAPAAPVRAARPAMRDEAVAAVDRVRGTSHATFEPRERPAPREYADAGVKKTLLSIAVGKNDGIRPADIVGSIANEAGVPGRDIGPIEIRDDVTIVAVPESYGEQVITALKGKKFRGRPINAQVAEEGETIRRRPTKPFEREDRGEARPRFRRDESAPRPYSRDSAAPRPPFRPRTGEDRPAPRFERSSTRPPRRDYDSPRPPRKDFDSPRPPRKDFDSPRPPRKPFDSARPPRRDFDSPRPPRKEYDSTRPPRKEFDSARPARAPYPTPRTTRPTRRSDEGGPRYAKEERDRGKGTAKGFYSTFAKKKGPKGKK